MENDLDIVLLNRNSRSIQLTPAGQKVYDLCVNAVDSLRHAIGEVGHKLQNTALQGVVTISGSNLYLSEIIMPLLPDLYENFPLVRIDLVGGDYPIDQRAEDVDLRIRVGKVDTVGMKAYPLAPLERVLCGHRDFLRDAELPIDPSDLPRFPFVLRTQESPEWVFGKSDQTIKCHVTAPVLRVNSYELCVSAVRAGLGVAVLAKAVVQNDINDGSIKELLPAWTVDPIPVSLVVPMSRLRRPEVIAVARYIVGKVRVRPGS